MPAYHAGDPGSIPGSGRPGEGYGNPLQCSCLKNPMDGGTWRIYSPWGLKESDTIDRLHFSHTPTKVNIWGDSYVDYLDVENFFHNAKIYHIIMLCILYCNFVNYTSLKLETELYMHIVTFFSPNCHNISISSSNVAKFSSPTSLSSFDIINHFNFSHWSPCALVSHCGFNLFP